MKKLSVLIVVIVLLLFACGGEGENNIFNILFPEASARSAKFWAQDISNSAFYQVDAQMLAGNDFCEVWAEKGSGVTAYMAKNVADEYANVIYVKMMNTFGYTIDDPDLGKVNTMEIAHWIASGNTNGAKLTILLLDIKDGYNVTGDPYVGGYFYPFDLLKNDPVNYPDNKSNELEMIYIDTYPSVSGSAESYETLAHEMQHLMNFVTTIVCRENLMDTWIDEGLSAAAEWVYSGQHPEDRWKYYNEDPSKLIAKGNNFFIWNNRNDNQFANLDDYATVYIFFQYLRLQSGKPEDIYFDIHTSEFSDYQAVTAAEDINSAHKDKWQKLLRDWHAANYTNSADGLYGYKNDPVLKDVKAPMVPAGITSLDLYPGEGVYSKTSAAGALPAASDKIKYAGLGSSGTTPSDSAGFTNGAQLTYNVDTNLTSDKVTGSTTGIASSVEISILDENRSIQASGSNKFTYPFKVDASYFHKRNGKGNIPDKKITSLFNNKKNRSINDNNMIKIDKSTIERVYINE